MTNKDEEKRNDKKPDGGGRKECRVNRIDKEGRCKERRGGGGEETVQNEKKIILRERDDSGRGFGKDAKKEGTLGKGTGSRRGRLEMPF